MISAIVIQLQVSGFQRRTKSFTALKQYILFQTPQYADWRNACINATDLYGAASPESRSHYKMRGTQWASAQQQAERNLQCPTSLASSAVTATTATVSWAAAPGALSYNLQYKTAASANGRQ